MTLKFIEKKANPRYKAQPDTEKLRWGLLPLDERRYYNPKTTGEDEHGEYVELEFAGGPIKLPKDWFIEVEPPQLAGTQTVIMKGWSPDKSRNLETIRKNPYATTLDEYQKKIDKNTQKANELHSK
jgi:hypothetical protein